MVIKRFKKQNSYEIENPLDTFSCQACQKESRERIGDIKDKWQAKAFIIFALSILVFFWIRVAYLQIWQGKYYVNLANSNRIRKDIIRAPRGIIVDENGVVLARNIPSFELDFIPIYLLANQESAKNAVGMISEITGKNKDELLSIIKGAPDNSRDTYQLIEHLSDDEALRLEERVEEFTGLIVSSVSGRDYPLGKVMSHIIGYDGKINKKEMEEYPDYSLIDYVGKNGVEEVYEKYLHGVHGEHRYEVDSRGQVIRDMGVSVPRNGYELVLNIDSTLQEKIYHEAEKMIQKNKDAKSVVVVAIDPRNGAVRAMVSYPSYDDNLFVRGIKKQEYQALLSNPRKPLINKAISGVYPPGSTFKPLVATAALQEGVIDENTTVDCHGFISIGRWKFPDWTTHGVTDVKKAIAQSCDVFFYAVGGGWESVKGLGIDKLNKYAEFFGLGNYLGIDLPGEKKGNVPGGTWKFKTFGEKWYIGDTYHASIGQGYVTVTPLQIANVIATIANGGTVYQPRIAQKLINPETKEEIKIKPKKLNENFISGKNIKIVQEGMRQTVTDGSGRLLNDLQVKTAGKTGTAQFGNEDKTHSWYVSYAPYDNPKLAMVVLVEAGGEGHSWAVPLTKEVYKWYFDEREKNETNSFK